MVSDFVRCIRTARCPACPPQKRVKSIRKTVRRGNRFNNTDIKQPVIYDCLRHNFHPTAITGRDAGGGQKDFTCAGAEVAFQASNNRLVTEKRPDCRIDIRSCSGKRRALVSHAPSDFSIEPTRQNRNEIMFLQPCQGQPARVAPFNSTSMASAGFVGIFNASAKSFPLPAWQNAKHHVPASLQSR